jgi:hypothetical protein
MGFLGFWGFFSATLYKMAARSISAIFQALAKNNPRNPRNPILALLGDAASTALTNRAMP